jgi:hypothetical protein
MKHKIIFLNALLFLSLWITGLRAQEIVAPSGGNASGSGGSVSYSVGQVVYTTSTGANGSVAQGVQQPFEISVVSVNEEAAGITLTFLAYPNPTTEYLTLSIAGGVPVQYSAALYNIDGELLKTQKVVTNETNIVMSNLPPGTYLIRLIQGDKAVKIFKIIKN